MARSGSPLARSLAVGVLGASPERERAAAALGELYEETDGPLRADVIAALARAAPSDARVVEALADPHATVVGAAVRALATEPRKKPRPEVLALLADESRGADVLPALVEYFCFPGQQLDEETFVQLVRFAVREDLPVETRLAVLAGCPCFAADLTSRVRREFEPLLTSSNTPIREAALVALALRKDSRAKRDLLRDYDDKVEGSPGWPAAFQQRGDIHYRIAEYRDAAEDYEEALRLHGDNARLVGNRDLWVNLARAYVKDNKLKSAAETLEEFGIPSEVRKLRDDPDFLPLVENARYKTLFE
jgi:hypothetical protein